MSSVDTSLQYLEKAGDYLNAILVKETRQALKSKQFVITFMLLLLASWLISVFGVAMMGDSINYGSSGQNLFNSYFIVLMVAVTVIVPFGAYRSMLGEKEQNTFDALRITSLTPWQIVWGKLLSALLQVFIFYSAIAPFIAFTSLLEGFELPAVVFVLVCGMLISMSLSIFSLMVSTFANQRHWQGVLSILLLIGLLFMLSMTLSTLLGMFMWGGTPFDTVEFWWGTGIVLLYCLSYCWLFMQITSAQLTFESGNRSTGIRLSSTVQLVLIWGAIGASVWFSPLGFDEDVFVMISGLTLVHFTILGLVAATEENYLSRRIRKSMSPRPLSRLLMAPFLPGGSRGLVYVLLNLTILTFLFSWCVIGMSTVSGAITDIDALLYSVFGTVCYMVIYMGFGCWIGRLAGSASADIRPNHVRVLTLILFAIGCIMPLIATAAELIKWNQYSFLYLTNPFSTVAELSKTRGTADAILIVLGGAALLIVLVNLRAMWNGVAEILSLKGDEHTSQVTVQPFQIPVDTEPQPTAEA